MENDTLISSTAKAIKRGATEMNLPEKQITELFLNSIKKEIEEKLNELKEPTQETKTKLSDISRADLEHYNLGMENQLREKDKQINELFEELEKQKQVTNNVIELAKQHEQDLIDIYEKKKIPKNVYRVLKEMERIDPKIYYARTTKIKKKH